MNWNPDTLPSLSGKTFVVTGGNSGLGFEATRILRGKGARLVITTRSEAKARDAVAALRSAGPNADVDFVLLDLTEPESIDAAAATILEKCPRLHACINNAGVMQTPERRTSEGFELQFATNHLGHFRLNRLLLARLEDDAGRIVPVSSVAHRSGTIDLDNLNAEKEYDTTRAYSQSKLANLMYAFELQRRLAGRGSAVACIPCHPGYAATNLRSTGVGMEGGSAFLRGLYKVLNLVIAHSAEKGAWPLVLTAADPKAEASVYYGPTGLGGARGKVGKSVAAARAEDQVVAKALLQKTEQLVGPFFAC
ncbi:MAG: NAD(P)-dependent dehydrogenase (short-subunit alcohol dehydrogenase family) [Bradymonadia bacterium]|jgi:NAD(P)-dependent dehydrogenase (short-subunit alcohol dehydrogenase family)